MSVQEIYSVELEGGALDLAANLDVAERLAAFTRLELAWAAMWTNAPGDDGVLVVERPTRPELLSVLGVENDAMAVAHWDAEGADPAWLSFTDPLGARREDARIYRIELARNALPLTTMGAGPGHPDFALGPEPARGWALALVVIRDHMPREELVRQLAEAAALPSEAITHASR